MVRKCRLCEWWKGKVEQVGRCRNKNVGVRHLDSSTRNKLYTIDSQLWYGAQTESDFGCIHFLPNRLKLGEIAKAIRKQAVVSAMTPAELKEILTYWSLKPAHLAHLLGVTRQCVNDWLKRDKHPVPRIAIAAMTAMGLFPIPVEKEASRTKKDKTSKSV